MGFMGLGSILGVALIAFVIWTLFKSPRIHPGASEQPEDTLKRRYASGEIDRDTYQRMLADVKS